MLNHDAATQKRFIFHWLDGKDETLEGVDPKDAFQKAGYGNGAIKALDWIESVDETPMIEEEACS